MKEKEDLTDMIAKARIKLALLEAAVKSNTDIAKKIKSAHVKVILNDVKEGGKV